MSIDYDKIGGFQVVLKSDTSIGLALRSIYEHAYYFTKKYSAVKKVSVNIYYTLKEDLQLKDNVKITSKYLSIEDLMIDLIKKVKETKTLDHDCVFGLKAYINLYDDDSKRFTLFNFDNNEVMIEFNDKTKAFKHISIKPIPNKANCKAYIFSKECEIDFVKKISKETFLEIEKAVKDYEFITVAELKKRIEERETKKLETKSQPLENTDLEYLEADDEYEEVEAELEESIEEELNDKVEELPSTKDEADYKQDDDDLFSSILGEDDIKKE